MDVAGWRGPAANLLFFDINVLFHFESGDGAQSFTVIQDQGHR